MVYINWKRILDNPPRPALKAILYSGKPELLKGLYENGFTEYFTSDYPRMITQEQAVAMFRGKSLDVALDSFLLNYPVPFFLFDIIGFNIGRLLSFPAWFSETDKKFSQSLIVAGNEVVYERVRYVVLFNNVYSDPIQRPMLRYQFLAVPSLVFPTTQGEYLAFEENTLQTSLP